MEKHTNVIAEWTDTEQKRLCLLACQTALKAGEIILKQYEQPHAIRMKGTIDLVTETDVLSEAAIIEMLSANRPDIPIMAEESPSTHGKMSERLWVVDPLDGTTNFAHGFPYFAVSIALLESGRPTVAAIYAPLLHELFYACQGHGAWLNDGKIAVTPTEHGIEALIGTGFPYEIEQTLDDVLRHLGAVLPRVRDIRRAGAAALDLAYVACGRLDGFYERNLKPWDTAAGWLLVEEAGGRVSDFAGGDYSPFVPEIVASNGRLHSALLAMLQ